MKKIIPYFLFVFAIIFATLVWEFITLPFNPENVPIGDSYLDRQHHSQNDTLRFIFFLSLPFITIIFYYHFFEKKFFGNIKKLIFQTEKTSFEIQNKLKFFFFITLSIIIFEFFLIDFENLNHHIDIFHEGLWLTPSSNARLTGDFWQSTYIARGFFGNFYPYLFWKIFGIETIGLTRFVDLFFILLNKILILLITYRITLIIDLEKNQKILFYLILSLSLLTFTSYMSPIFFLRSFLLLLFSVLILNFFIADKKKINLFLIGCLSSLSMFWYIDIGIYINVILIIALFFFIIRKEFKNFLILLFAIIFGWLIIYLKFPANEWSLFLQNLKLIIMTIDYIHGLIFPTPFLSQDTRSTKAMLLFLITGFLILRGINDLNDKDAKFIFIISIFFIISILQFKYGLSRSDGGHVKIATGFIYLPLLPILFYKIINYSINKKIYNYIHINKINYFVLLIFLSSIFIDKKFENKDIRNLFAFKTSIVKFINLSDDKFINNDYKKFISFYKNISKQDDCVMVFTNEAALPYFFKKPSCSKYYLSYVSTPLTIQKNIIRDLNNTKPKFLIYKSNIDLYGHSGNRLKLIDGFIKEEYSFHQKYVHWDIYKKNK